MLTNYWHHLAAGPLTGDQHERCRQAITATVKKLRDDRSEESIAETIDLLKVLLAMPEREDLRELGTQFYWRLYENGEVHREIYYGCYPRLSWCHENQLLRLDFRGLEICRLMRDRGNRIGFFRVGEDEYPDFIRRFMIFPDELCEVMNLLRAKDIPTQ